MLNLSGHALLRLSVVIVIAALTIFALANSRAKDVPPNVSNITD